MKTLCKNYYFFVPISFVIITLIAGATVYAQDKTSEVDKIFGWAKPDAPGCSVAVSLKGKLVVNRAYGSADLERDVAITTNSIFDVGSVRKQFIAAAVLLLVEDKRVTLSDDIRKYFPEMPDSGHKVTINHLLTHTSGVRDWTALQPLAGENAEILPLILRQRGLNFAPGDEWGYSNSNYVVLTELVTRASGMPFAEFSRKRLFEPLGMKSTSYQEDMLGVIKNRSLAYAKDGNNWKLDMVLGNKRGKGSGAILTTASDLVIWSDALANRRLGHFVTEKMLEQTKLNNGRTVGYARGLNVNHSPGATIVSHSGGANGYSSWTGFIPEHGLSVAVLCNADSMGTANLARRVADLFLPPLDPNAQAPGPVAVAGVDFTGRAGLYLNERTLEPLRLAVNNGRLTIVTGPVLVPVSADTFRPQRANLFFRSQDEFELHFLSQDQLEIKSMEGETTRFRRPQPFAPTAADLKAFAGQYQSDELRSVFQITPSKDGLMISISNTPDTSFEFKPADPDTFMLGALVSIRFRRDKDGKVVSLDYISQAIRNIKYTRVSEGAMVFSPEPTPVTREASVAPAPRLEDLVGEYELAAGRSIIVTLENGQLYGQPTGSTKATLVHVSGAMFGIGRADAAGTVTFELGGDGRAIAMVMRQNGNERRLTKVR